MFEIRLKNRAKYAPYALVIIQKQSFIFVKNLFRFTGPQTSGKGKKLWTFSQKVSLKRKITSTSMPLLLHWAVNEFPAFPQENVIGKIIVLSNDQRHASQLERRISDQPE